MSRAGALHGVVGCALGGWVLGAQTSSQAMGGWGFWARGKRAVTQGKGAAAARTARGHAVHGTHPSGRWRKPCKLALVKTRERCEPYERCNSPVDRCRREFDFSDSDDDQESSRRSSRGCEGESGIGG